MTNKYIFSADVSNHSTGNSTGESALIFPVKILCTITNMLAVNRISNSFQSSEGRENNNLVKSAIGFHNNIFSKLYCFVNSFVHFPVACNHFAANIVQCCHAWENLAFQIFQRSTAAGGNMGNAFCQAKFFNSCNRVAAADNAGCTAFSNSLRYCFSALAECVHFKYAHRSVPNNHLGVLQSFGVSLAGFFANIKSHVILVQLFQALVYMLSIRSKCFCHYQVSRQQHFHAIFLSLSQKLLS
ncbi:hypothetical protein EVA_14924 [gut metagenome]|uniref:Uncharacterized protein n=1 Tax=gut metagenome TaxID=749906 RepID=J9GC42_9ZZZZ